MRDHCLRFLGLCFLGLCFLGLRFLGILSVLGLASCVEAPPVIESTTVLSSTPNTVGPYMVQSVITGVTDHAVELRYRVDDDPRFVPLPMLADGERFSAGIPGRPAGTSISYYVTVLHDGQRIVDDPQGAGAAPYAFMILAE